MLRVGSAWFESRYGHDQGPSGSLEKGILLMWRRLFSRDLNNSDEPRITVAEARALAGNDDVDRYAHLIRPQDRARFNRSAR